MAQPPTAHTGMGGLQAKMWAELRANAGPSTVPVTDIPGRLTRRPSSTNVTIDEYVAKHSDEFDRLLALDGPDGWDFNREEDGVKVYTMTCDGRNVPYFKAVTEVSVEGGLARILHVLLHTEERPKWDEVCVKGSSEQHFPPFYKYTHTQSSSPAPMVSAREMFTLGRYRFEPDGTFLWTLQSVDLDEFPPDPQFVRANLIDGGHIIRPKPGSTTDFTVTWTACIDPNGWVPKWVVNLKVTQQALVLAKAKAHF
mmetsp:Transcript_73103/g.143398  ORF Transcript_73103/g.143398 Transcript_73103/m.143398 type:complete len:254 (+) Transcript_73103:84-845(+)